MVSNAGYGENAEALIEQWEALEFRTVHAKFLDLLPAMPCSVLDVGAGTGRDAAHFAAHGCKVVAVEPTAEFRDGGARLHPAGNINWVDDHLPKLARLQAPGQTFDVVMLSAVWMHLDATERMSAMQRLATLTHAGSRVFISLRHGPVPAGRIMYEVTGEETRQLAAEHGFRTLLVERNKSIQGGNQAAGVSWTKLVLER